MTAKRQGGLTTGLPSESELIAFIAKSPGQVRKRDIVRAFGIKSSDRSALKALLKDIESKGLLRGGGRKLAADGVLPAIALVEVSGIDEDGELLAEPVDWDELRAGPKPVLRLQSSGPVAPGLGDRVLAQMRAENGGYVAVPLRFDRPPPTQVLGVMRLHPSGGGRILSAAPKDRAHYLVQHEDLAGAEDGELVSADVLRMPKRGLGQARVRKRLGPADDPRKTSLLAICAHGIATDFPKAVLEEVRSLRRYSMSGREDLRDLPFITIDPADARDHDDAIWAEADTDPSNRGGHKLKIAIADVAAYVRPQSALDREARRRGNSVYFPDRVVPMLPERLSNELCSLKPGEDRPAIVCHLTVDAQGKGLTARFSRAVIRIAAGLSYEDAQAAMDGMGPAHAQALLDRALRPLWLAYGVLSLSRDRRGPLELDLPERKILLDQSGKFVGVTVPERLEAHRLVEEFMIRANVAAAEALNRKKTPLLFRIHDKPSAEKLRGLRDFLRTVGISFALGQVIRPKTFNRILSAARNQPHERLVHEVVLRSQAQAQYSARNTGHFGLGLADYTHFTSPIRRYADLIVHRALISAFDLGDDGLSAVDIKQIDETAEMVSAAERRAMMAERETVDRFVAAFLADKVGSCFEGRISGVVPAGLFVILSATGADGFLPVSALGHERFHLHRIGHALVGARTGTTYQLGDAITVRLVEVMPLKGGMRFELASGPSMPARGRRNGALSQRRRGK